MNFHPLSIKLLKKEEVEPIYLKEKNEMNTSEFIALVSLELDKTTFHIGDIIYVNETFYIFTLIPSLKLNQYGLESFGFISFRENKQFFIDFTNNYKSDKKMSCVLNHQDIYYFTNIDVQNAINMSKSNYLFVGNVFYMNNDYITGLMHDILIDKYPNKEFEINLDKLHNPINSLYITNFRFVISHNEIETSLTEMNTNEDLRDILWSIYSTNDWSFRLIASNNAKIKRLESISSNSYLAGTIFEFKENEENKTIINDIINENDYYKSIIDKDLNNQKQILFYLTKEGIIEYVDKESNSIEDAMPLIPLRNKYFDIIHKYSDESYNQKILNIIG